MAKSAMVLDLKLKLTPSEPLNAILKRNKSPNVANGSSMPIIRPT
jgi:hypothetical protein